MSEDLSKLKDIIRTNIRNIKEVADSLLHLKEKLSATEETVAEVVNKLENIESKSGPITNDGIRMFGVSSNEANAAVAGIPDLDLDHSELGKIIAQHPNWLRPFSVVAELEKHELDAEILRLKRSSSGYMRIIKLSNGTEWAYLEEISFDRYSRLVLLQQVFDIISLNAKWSTAWVKEPVKLQSLQKGARWEIMTKGKLITEK